MFLRASVVLAVLMLGAGCTSGGDTSPVTAHHPASPEAAESQLGPPSQTLVSDVAPSAEKPNDTKHDVGGMSHSMPGMLHGDTAATTKPSTTQSAMIYTCPMHPQIVTAKPGNCPICGMKLVVKQDSMMPGHEGHE